MFITIFTPTYNRAYCLPNLYESLCKQTNHDFVWLLVDDGSTDNTRDLVDHWRKEGKINVEYHYQPNQGKSMAHNEGVRLTRTPLFTCVDSDDTLTPNAVDVIADAWKRMDIKHNTGLLLLRKFYSSDGINTTVIPEGLKEATLYDAYNVYGLRGDTMLVFRSEVIKKIEFPQFPGEKFVPESYLYDLIDSKGTLRMIRESVYECEYLEDGYTCNMARLLKRNPQGYIAYINQRLRLHDKSVKARFMDSVRYVSMMLTFNKRGLLSNAVYPGYVLLALPIGYILYMKKYRGL